jgi:hypothetical protein
MGVVSARWLSGQTNLAWIGAIPIVGGVLGWSLHRRRQAGWAFGSLAVTSAVLLAALFAVAAVPISRRQNSVLLAEMIQRAIDKPDQLGLFGIGFAGVVYYADRPIHDYKRNRWSAQSFFENWDRPMLVTDADGYQRLRNLLPADAKIVERHPRFLKRGDLIVVAREPPSGSAAKSTQPPDERPPMEQALREYNTSPKR